MLGTSATPPERRTMIEWTFVGTHTGAVALPDGSQLAPTGKRVEIRGMEFVHGKIVVDNLYYDNMVVLAQLGFVPEGAVA
jgi:SnoaL-like polyketide cyclase